MDLLIDKFEAVVDLLRETGTYTDAVLADGEYTVEGLPGDLAVKDYILFNGSVPARVLEIMDSVHFKVLAQGVLTNTGSWKALAPYSDYGTRKSINAKLLEKQGGEYSYQKYPLIALRLPSTIPTENGVSTVDANVLIATFTRKQDKPQDRIANTFKPVLYPLTTRFLQMLRLSGEFLMYEPKSSQIDRMFYGTESGDESNIANVFDDPLDAVELRDLELKFIADNCQL